MISTPGPQRSGPNTSTGSGCWHLSSAPALTFLPVLHPLGEAAQVPRGKTPPEEFSFTRGGLKLGQSIQLQVLSISHPSDPPVLPAELLLPLTAGLCPAPVDFSSIILLQRPFPAQFPGEGLLAATLGQCWSSHSPSWEQNEAIPQLQGRSRNSSEVVLSANHPCSLATRQKEVQASHC